MNSITAHKHYILNKPYGYLSQFINRQNKRKNKRLLGELYDFAPGTMAIGRLDETSEGLLFLTTDGKESEFIRSAKVAKEYHVQVDGIVDEQAITALKNGLTITVHGQAYQTKPCDAFLLPLGSNYPMANRKVRDARHGPTSWLGIVIHEGKFRQVRKMTAKVGFPTLRLVRVRIGDTQLTLGPGEVKEIAQFNTKS